MIAVIDCKAGNLTSVVNALRYPYGDPSAATRILKKEARRAPWRKLTNKQRLQLRPSFRDQHPFVMGIMSVSSSFLSGKGLRLLISCWG
jgi:hypothetical protein